MFNRMEGPIKDEEDGILDDSAELCTNCCDCKKLHPFCELHNIGLLGTIQKSEAGKVQTFKKPHELRGNLQSSLSRNSEGYLLHPSLNRHIKENRDRQGLSFSTTKFVTVFNTHPWTEIDGLMLEIQRKIETLETKESTRKKLEDIFANVYNKDANNDLAKLEDQLISTIDFLEKKAKETNTDANKSKLSRGTQQWEQITDIIKLLSKLNKKLLST